MQYKGIAWNTPRVHVLGLYRIFSFGYCSSEKKSIINNIFRPVIMRDWF